jgi:hypothetical protein
MLETDGLQWIAVTADAAAGWAPPTKQYGVTFDVAARFRGRDTSVLMRILDQGNSVLGRIHGMGFGLRAPLPMPGTTGSATPVPAGVRLLPFAIVAKVPACNDDQLAAVYAELRRLGIGSGNYERWESTTTFYVYDIDRSIGYLVNTPGKIKGAKPNLKIVLPKADSWVAWLNSSKTIKSGDHLWVSYGSGSDHHRMTSAVCYPGWWQRQDSAVALQGQEPAPRQHHTDTKALASALAGTTRLAPIRQERRWRQASQRAPTALATRGSVHTCGRSSTRTWLVCAPCLGRAITTGCSTRVMDVVGLFGETQISCPSREYFFHLFLSYFS